MSIQALRAKRVEIANKMQALVKKEGAWTAERQTEFQAMAVEVEQIDNQIKAIEQTLAIAEGVAANDENTARFHGVSVENAAELRREVLVAYLRDGRAGVEALAQAGRIQNAQTVGSNTGGGYTVQREMWGSIVAAMRQFGGMREVAQVITTGNGNPLDFVTTDATSEEGQLLGENTQANAGDTTFGLASMGAYKFSSKVIAVSLELLQDSEFDIEAYITELLGLRLGRAANRYFTVGTGSNEPQGIVTAAGAGKVGTTGQTTSITYDDLVDLEHSVDPIYRGNALWMFHDNTLKKLKQLKDTTNRPIWLPGLTEKAPDSILGYGYQVNQHMAPMAANAKSMLFGDFKKYLIRDVLGAILYRNTDSKYNEQGLVGFHSIMRTDGKMVDVGGAIKYYQNSAT